MAVDQNDIGGTPSNRGGRFVERQPVAITHREVRLEAIARPPPPSEPPDTVADRMSQRAQCANTSRRTQHDRPVAAPKAIEDPRDRFTDELARTPHNHTLQPH